MKRREKLTPTAEQEAILGATGRRVMINARAGTGKTATMQMLAESLSSAGQKVLYLVYNKRAQEEARACIPSCIARAYTVHGLSLRSIPASRKVKVANHNLHASDFLEVLPNGAMKPQTAALVAMRFLTYFLNSAWGKLDHAVDAFSSDHLPKQLRNSFSHDSQGIINALRTLMVSWGSGELPCPHDYYLKLSQHEGWLTAEMSRYDVLLVDEAQDLSPVMLEVMRDYDGRIFAVGDSHQQIYSFRHAINAMEELECDATLSLTHSFRFGQPIARLVTAFVRDIKGERNFTLTGDSSRSSTVELDEAGSARVGAGSALIARTNYSLFESAVEMLNCGTSFHFARDVGTRVQRAWDIYNLQCGNKSKIRDRLLTAFANIAELNAHAEEMDDRELRGLIRFVEGHGSRIPGILTRLSKVPLTAESPDTNQAVLTTIHGAKGLEFDEAVLAEDMYGRLSRAIARSTDEQDEEVNMVYVAMTRAKRRLILPKSAKDLPGSWPKPAHYQLLRAATPEPEHRRRLERTRGVTGSKSGEAGRPDQEKEDSRQVLGARVSTPLGFGRVIPAEEKNETVLVKLDGEAKPVRLVKRLVTGI